MPVVQTTAYGTVESILLRARAILNDMEVSAGDVLTDQSPATMQYVSGAYERIQAYLAQYGVETYADEIWLLNIPANTTGDPESRVIISDSGTEIFTPSGANEATFAEPILPNNLVAPLKLRERPNGSLLFAAPMYRRNDGLAPWRSQWTYLIDWQWQADELTFRGATANQDVWMKYEKALPLLSQVTDTVPIRGVTNAAAYRTAYMSSKGKGGAMADSFGAEGQAELDLIVNRSVRERQRVNHRRRPYSRCRGNGSTRGYY